MTFADQSVAVFCRAAILPDDGVMNRFTRRAIPDECRLALVRDAHRTDLVLREPGLAESLDRDGRLRTPDLVCVVLDPTGLRVVLLEFLLCDGQYRARAIEKNGARTGGALIEGENGLHLLSPERMCRRGSK